MASVRKVVQRTGQLMARVQYRLFECAGPRLQDIEEFDRRDYISANSARLFSVNSRR